MRVLKRILLVEDDDFKRRNILDLITVFHPTSEVLCAASVSASVLSLKQGSYDLIILDVSLPSHDAGGGAAALSLPSGGLEVLLELSFEGRSDPVIILTQYPLIEFEGRSIAISDATKLLKADMEINLLEVIQYTRMSDSWIKKVVEHL